MSQFPLPSVLIKRITHAASITFVYAVELLVSLMYDSFLWKKCNTNTFCKIVITNNTVNRSYAILIADWNLVICSFAVLFDLVHRYIYERAFTHHPLLVRNFEPARCRASPHLPRYSRSTSPAPPSSVHFLRSRFTVLCSCVLLESVAWYFCRTQNLFFFFGGGAR